MSVPAIAGWAIIIGLAVGFLLGLISVALEAPRWWRRLRPAPRVQLERPQPRQTAGRF